MTAAARDAVEAAVFDMISNIADGWGKNPVGPTTMGSTFLELGFDSLDVIELASKIDLRFGITIPDDRWTNKLTVSGAIALVVEITGAAK